MTEKKELKEWTNQQLQRLVEEISIKYFKRTFKHEARFNSRLRTTGGRYMLQSHAIEINPKQLEYYGIDAVIDIIKHELCHYHLHIEGRGYKHRDRDFIELMKEVGAPRYCAHIPGTKNVQKIIHRYECKKCKRQYERKRRINVDKYVCGVCRGFLNKIK